MTGAKEFWYFGNKILQFWNSFPSLKSQTRLKCMIQGVVVGTDPLHFVVLESVVRISVSLLQWMVTQMKSILSLKLLDMHLVFLFTPSFPSLLSNYSGYSKSYFYLWFNSKCQHTYYMLCAILHNDFHIQYILAHLKKLLPPTKGGPRPKCLIRVHMSSGSTFNYFISLYKCTLLHLEWGPTLFLLKGSIGPICWLRLAKLQLKGPINPS
jgi:hypothetical protein